MGKNIGTGNPVKKKPLSEKPSPTLWERILAFLGLR